MSNSDVIEKIVAEFAIVEKEFKMKAQTALKTAFTQFFSENPKIGSVYWTQYSPFFNDGDECIFGVKEMYCTIGEITKTINAEDFDCFEDREDAFTSYGNGNETFNEKYKPEIENFKSFSRLINKLPDDVFELTFGNHVQVTATRAGFDVDEYDHE